MKRNRHTEEQINSILKLSERGVSIAELAPPERSDRADHLPLDGQVQRHGGFGGQARAGGGE